MFNVLRCCEDNISNTLFLVIDTLDKSNFFSKGVKRRMMRTNILNHKKRLLTYSSHLADHNRHKNANETVRIYTERFNEACSNLLDMIKTEDAHSLQVKHWIREIQIQCRFMIMTIKQHNVFNEIRKQHT